MYSSSSPKNTLQKALHDTSREAGNPSDEADRIIYGVITEVDYERSQVKVKRLLSDGRAGEEIPGGFFPLSTPLFVVHQLFGALREGLIVRIYYRGKLNPKNVIIEIIGDETHTLVNKAPQNNEIEIGPWKIFAGGIGL